MSGLYRSFENTLPSVPCDEIPVFLRHFHDQVRTRYQNLSTIQAIFSQMRKCVQRTRPECTRHCLKHMRLAKHERDRLRLASGQRIQQANREAHVFSISQIQQTCRFLANSTDPIDKILLLMLQSGLRLVEVLRQAHISPGTHPSYVRTYNLAKSGNSTEKPLLFTDYNQFARQFAQTRDYVRQSIGNDRYRRSTNKDLTNHFNQAVNTRVHRTLGPRYTSHIARKIYGVASYVKHGEHQSTHSLNSWLETVLGHKSITASLSYSNVKVTPD